MHERSDESVGAGADAGGDAYEGPSDRVTPGE